MATQTFRSNKYRTKCVGIVDALGDTPEFIVFDLETTGLNYKTSRIIEFAGIRYRFGECGMLDDIENGLETLHLYINPGFIIDENIEKLTGITNDFLADKPYEEDVFPQIAAFLGNTGRLILSGYNIDNFDIKFMKELYARYNADWPCVDTVDVIELARDIFPPSEVPNYKLGTIAHYCDFDDGVQFHSAIEDAKVTAKVFQICYLNYLADIEDEKNRASAVPPKMRPQILSVNFWEGYRGMSRIYVDLDCGKVYFDVVKKTWCPKDNSTDISIIDMEAVESECLARAGVSTLAEFARIEANKKNQPTTNFAPVPSAPQPAAKRSVAEDKIKPDIFSICFWEGIKGWARIYVDTSHGSLYLNVRDMSWKPKDADLCVLDIQYIEQKCLDLTGTADLAEFATFTGRIRVTK